MRPVDEAALQTLRKAVGDSVDPAVWAEIEKQVEQRGIDNLTGSAALAVQALVRKHGSPGDKGYAQMHPDSKSGGAASGDAPSGGDGVAEFKSPGFGTVISVKGGTASLNGKTFKGSSDESLDLASDLGGGLGQNAKSKAGRAQLAHDRKAQRALAADQQKIIDAVGGPENARALIAAGRSQTGVFEYRHTNAPGANMESHTQSARMASERYAQTRSAMAGVVTGRTNPEWTQRAAAMALVDLGSLRGFYDRWPGRKPR